MEHRLGGQIGEGDALGGEDGADVEDGSALPVRGGVDLGDGGEVPVEALVVLGDPEGLRVVLEVVGAERLEAGLDDPQAEQGLDALGLPRPGGLR